MYPYDNEPDPSPRDAVRELLEQHGFSDDVCNEIATIIQREESRLWAEKERQFELDRASDHQRHARRWAAASREDHDLQHRIFFQNLAADQARNARQWMGIESWDEVGLGSDFPF